MALQERRGEGSRTGWLTTAFWIFTALFMFRLIGILSWWEWLVFIVAGVALTYFWWRARRRSRYSLLFGATCAFIAASALAISGAAVLDTTSAPIGSVGSRKVDCGSVVNPMSGSELTVTTRSGEPVAQSQPIPQSSLERVCSSRLRYRMSGAVGLTLVGLLITVRATGHLLPRRSSATPVTPARQA
jgi:hypothetical protein